MAKHKDAYNPFTLVWVGAAAWAVPGAGYVVQGDHKRALVVCITIALTFCLGLYIGSIGVIDSVGAKPWYAAQLMNSPGVILIAQHVARTNSYPVYGRPAEIGQIYTSIAGLLNLLCIVNSVYMAHSRQTQLEAQ
ncbi:MAG: hypothetical protein HQ515_05345 [Phycisphaeraceae bacterium]|nr:hypothetical protein [Phycisphaeraceae bacterium]